MAPHRQPQVGSNPAPFPASLVGMEIIEPLCAVFRRTLRAEGLKYTSERAHVLDAIVRYDALFDAEALLASLKSAGLRASKATVYRTIKLMLEAGMLMRVPLDEDPARYVLTYGRKPHELLINLDTRHVEAIDLPDIRKSIDALCKQRGLSHQSHRLQIFVRS